MKDSKNSSRTKADTEPALNFPSGAIPRSGAPQLSLDEIVALSEERLPFITAHPEWWAERMRSKKVPFKL